MASDTLPPDFKIISSLRYDPTLPAVLAQRAADFYPDPLKTPYYLLPYHQERLRNAATCFGWDSAVTFLKQDLSQFVRFLDSFIPDNTKPWRLRIVIDSTGTCDVEVSLTTSMDPLNLLIPSESNSSPSNTWRVYVDPERLAPSALTTHKTTARDFYNAARLRSGIASPLEQAEVLLVNPAGEIMEGSITTVYFRRRNTTGGGDGAGAQWVTPPLSCGGNAGTTRHYALAQGFCTEQVVAAADLVDGEECWLSNGVRGFIRGKIVWQGDQVGNHMIQLVKAEGMKLIWPIISCIKNITCSISVTDIQNCQWGWESDDRSGPSATPALRIQTSADRPEADRNSSTFSPSFPLHPPPLLHCLHPSIHPSIHLSIHPSVLYASSAIMKFFENVFTYDYSFPAVSLAYFLRYPNPYSRHVLTTDVIDRYVDPDTQRLHTTRLHLKKSKVPSGILKLLPKGIGGSDNSGQSYILETTIVDAKEGWMKTESRNMEWTGILSVIEKQHYQRQPIEGGLATLEGLSLDEKRNEQTTVRTTVTFQSRFGQGKLLGRKKAGPAGDHTGEHHEEEAPKRGLFSSLSTAGIQRTIELIGLNRTRDAVLKSKQGMNVVLERLRNGGIVAVLEGMHRDREAILGPEGGPWKRA
ncbi:D-aminoacid aminotransferase-like PLP-dependent enzyme [Aspergillus heteromorphus CBS 117.55]|uniref:D-aminoacid aminotransferase-like PLP-dependent enzyme n=1 Tax=Aspergillus heteromorphus CBS 117.55 TaxID=1448321 RepID=A0A317VLA1_9EURO|nr:D-aminoacid aminotransferase-like PLP-dependent enzyme [Aspergillus heteromorphus CBS 117.55]PWY75133.1 D-aminoacid aminotransferase-like PLP-dependent enzyme [Aspergillus heteromorphus CBS 117.55]